ncbi:HECT E3 ubiquitin ligase, partial [Thraustotheca clavata]
PVWYQRITSIVAMLMGFNGQMRNQDTVIESEGFLFIPNAHSLQVVGTSSLTHTIEDLSSHKKVQLCKAVLPINFPGQLTSLVNHVVVRGFDWEYGEEGGGAGSLGIILSEEPWAGHPNAAVRVYWLGNKVSGIYRYGYIGQYDVVLATDAITGHEQLVVQNSSLSVRHSSDSVPQSLKFAGHNSLTVNNLPSLHTDYTLQLSIRRQNQVNNEHQCLGQITSSAGWWMRLTVDGKKRLQFYLNTTQLEQTVCPKALDLSSWNQVDLCLFGSYIGIHVNGELCHNFKFTERLKCFEGASTLTLGEALDEAHKSWTGEIRNVRLWDAPMHMGVYYSQIFQRNYNMIDLGKTTPMTLDRLAAQSLKGLPTKNLSGQALEQVSLYRNFTVRNEHSDFASLRPRGVGVLSSACPHGKVYYELKLLSCSCLQLGWSFGNCHIESRDLGIGDCKLSFAVDLCRQSMWNADTIEITEAVWQPGDTLGCLLDWKNGEMMFSLNGRVLINASFKRDENNSMEHQSPRHGSELDGMGALFGLSDGEEEEFYETEEEVVEVIPVEAPIEGPIEAPIEAPIKPEPSDSQPTPNSWVDQGGIFPSGSFLTGDGAIWNLGQRPFEHLPEGYVSVMTAAGVPQNSAVVFEIFDFDEMSWQPVAFRHGVQDINPELLGEWLYSGVSTDSTIIPDTSRYNHDGVLKVAGEWTPDNETSLKLKCRPHFAKTTSEFEMPHRFLPPHSAFDIVHNKENEELVKYVNYVCDQEEWISDTLFTKSWSDIAPSSDALVRWPQLAKLCEQDASALSLRFGILVEFNRSVTLLLNYVSLAADRAPTSLASWIADARGMIFGVVKFELWNAQVVATATPASERTITLSRPKAARSRLLDPNRTNPFALFAQAYRAMTTWSPSAFCSNGSLYKVTFLGENAIDGGGPYRETFTEFCSELLSPQLPLLLPTSNGQHNVGHFRDAYVLHPTAHVHHSGMLTFLGKLFGVAIRTKGFLSLNISQIIWKQLVQDHITLEDLESVDALIVSSMRSIRDIEKNGITQEMFTDYITETFTTLSTDNRIVNLVPNGDTVQVTFDNRHEFVAAIEQYRLHEFDAAVEAVRRGLGMVVPLKYLRLFTWMELESMVCGSPFVDIDLLKKCTEYSSCSATDVHVTWFWGVLEAYSQDARRAFLRFVWGRSRLPRTLHEFQLGQRFKIQAFDRRPADNYMPVSHTCFFSLELPRYTSREVLEARLTYAIYNCQAIDGDGDTMAANQLGWED